jgi:3',5'-cyclic AMP phosphodiesterase CpdA
MRTIVHLSDLHFGRVRYEVLQPLLLSVEAAQPDLVAVSGDFTQRARRQEFLEARAFLDMLPKPQIVVPGNHDVPVRNLYKRFTDPLDRYRRYISPDLEPFYEDNEIAVAGLNTARGLSFKGGRISRVQIHTLAERLSGLPPRVTRLVVTHHPFDLPPSYRSHELVGRARLALETFAEHGADVFLAGHMHLTYSGHTAERYKIRNYAALVIQAGTATSNRERGEFNAFNIVRVHHGQIEVEPLSWDSDSGQFQSLRKDRFHKTNDGWKASV